MCIYAWKSRGATIKILFDFTAFYDIYKLLPLIDQTPEYKQLIREVRIVRSESSICPSAQDGIDIPGILKEIIDSNAYKEDYERLTIRLLEESVPYEMAIQALNKIIQNGSFE